MGYSDSLAKWFFEHGAVSVACEEELLWYADHPPVRLDVQRLLSDGSGAKIVVDGMAHIVRERKMKYERILGAKQEDDSLALRIADKLKCGHSRRFASDTNVLIVSGCLGDCTTETRKIRTLRDLGANIDNLLSVFDYQLPEARERLDGRMPPHRNERSLNYPCMPFALLTFNQLAAYAEKRGLWPADTLSGLRSVHEEKIAESILTKRA
ncbi:MAG: hypothetical protein HYS81_03340 [Candidatus Aenigmatarchaeota archaeon]|nr:MAG: hypothetical protein HYS81_03340 [Candidatus Aenigmarchaeota archaeon]